MTRAVWTAVLIIGLTASQCVSTPSAVAAPGMDGVYTARQGSVTTTWTIASSCSRSGCFAHVTSDQGWSQVAQRMDRRWTMQWLSKPDGVVCPDGGAAPATVLWWWDTESLSGVVSANHGAVCGNPPIPPGRTESPFSLTKIS